MKSIPFFFELFLILHMIIATSAIEFTYGVAEHEMGMYSESVMCNVCVENDSSSNARMVRKESVWQK